jgi:hypothetical protein
MRRTMIQMVVGLATLCGAMPAFAQQSSPIGEMVLYATLDKSTLLPGESVKVSMWAKLEPGVGTPVQYINQVGTWDATVWAYRSAHFNLLVNGPDGNWVEGFQYNKDLFKVAGPLYGNNILGGIALIQQAPIKTQADPILLCTTAWKPKTYPPNTTVDFTMQWIGGGNIFVDVPALGGQGVVAWNKALGASAVLTIVDDSCVPDCDGSTWLDIDDFICFQTLFAIGDPKADCDADGQLLIDDFICFQTLYALGC